MRYKTNISALLVAFVVLFSTSGVFIFEHICNTSKIRNFSVLKQTTCEMESIAASCCKEKKETRKKDCCEHKEFFSKLTYDGLLTKAIGIHPLIKLLNEHLFFVQNYTCFTSVTLYYASGLSPPEYIRNTEPLLLPTQADLQIFRC